ncbi:hypothetical protein HK104_003264 [Borealophlyctis nickersoniae]|nr:hypothetical protein HK104_003264 [Borealophlyctis nickersoniae]
MTVGDARMLKNEAKMVAMLQKQLVTYDGQWNVHSFNQFFPQLNHLFAFQFMFDEEKILVAITHLRSNANNWLQNQQRQCAVKHPGTPYHRSMSWNEWYALFHKAFYPVDAVTTAREKLSKLVQTKSCKAYCDAFTNLCLQVPDLSDAEQKDKFLRGLKEHVQLQIRLCHHAEMDSIPFETFLSLAQEIDTIYFASKNRNAVIHRIDFLLLRAPLTAAERKHLIANKGCFYCRKINCGHQVRNCPDKIAANKAKQLKINAASATPAAAAPLSDIDINFGIKSVSAVDPVPVAKTPTTHAASLRHSLAITDRQLQQQHVHINLSYSLLEPSPAISLNHELVFPGILDGVPVKILIDTGCTGLLVSERLVQQHPKFIKALEDYDCNLNFANKTQHESKSATSSSDLSTTMSSQVSPGPTTPWKVATSAATLVAMEHGSAEVVGDRVVDEDRTVVRKRGVQKRFTRIQKQWIERQPVTTTKFDWVSVTDSTSVSASDTASVSAVPSDPTSDSVFAPGKPPAIDSAISSIAVQQVQLMSKSSVDRTIRSSIFSGLINIKIDDKLAEDIKRANPSDEIQELLLEYTDVFQEPKGLPPERAESHKIKLMDENAPPPWRPIYHLSAQELEALHVRLAELLSKGYIMP